jgi:hypothetical protein
VFVANVLGRGIMRRRALAGLLFVLLLAVAAVPLAVSLSDSSSGVGSSSSFVPSMVVPEGVDIDGNGIEDLLDDEIELKVAEGNGSQLVDIVVLLDAAPSSVHTAAFRGNGGGEVRGPWQYAVYGDFIKIEILQTEKENLLKI